MITQAVTVARIHFCANRRHPNLRWATGYPHNLDGYQLTAHDPLAGVGASEFIPTLSIIHCRTDEQLEDVINLFADRLVASIRKFIMNRTAVLLGGPADLTRMAVPSYPGEIRVPVGPSPTTRRDWNGVTTDRYLYEARWTEAIYVRTAAARMSGTEIYEYDGTR